MAKFTQTLDLGLLGPKPISISINPQNPQIMSNAQAGALVATVSITMSDGSQFIGQIDLISDPQDDLLAWQE